MHTGIRRVQVAIILKLAEHLRMIRWWQFCVNICAFGGFTLVIDPVHSEQFGEFVSLKVGLW